MRAWLAAFLVAGAVACGGPGWAGPRDTALILSFRTLCTSERPNYAHIDQQAAAAGYQLLRNFDKPLGDGMFVRQKLWLVPQESGQAALMATEGNGPDGFMSGCGIVSSDINAEGFKPALVEAFKLGRPSLERSVPGQGVVMRMTRWDGAFGPGTSLQLLQGSQGAGLDYQTKGPRRP